MIKKMVMACAIAACALAGAAPEAMAVPTMAGPAQSGIHQPAPQNFWNPCAPRCSVKYCRWAWWKGTYRCVN
jgi:hypothetical protein